MFQPFLRFWNKIFTTDEFVEYIRVSTLLEILVVECEERNKFIIDLALVSTLLEILGGRSAMRRCTSSASLCFNPS